MHDRPQAIPRFGALLLAGLAVLLLLFTSPNPPHAFAGDSMDAGSLSPLESGPTVSAGQGDPTILDSPRPKASAAPIHPPAHRTIPWFALAWRLFLARLG